MDKLEQTKKELERLKDELIANNEGTMFEQGRISAFEDAVLWINTLQEDSISDDLEEAAKDFVSAISEKYIDSFYFPELEYFYKAGANWQKQKMLENTVPATVLTNQYGNKYIQSWSGLVQYDKFKNGEEVKVVIID